MQIILVFTDRK